MLCGVYPEPVRFAQGKLCEGAQHKRPQSSIGREVKTENPGQEGVSDLRVEVVRIEGEPVSIRLNGQEFPCEEETGQTIIPKKFLTGLRLSEIPDDITIKPVESIDDHVIEAQNDIALSLFSDGSASALVEEMYRRKFWDGEVGLSPYVAALRQAISEHEEAAELDFQDDGDYIFLHYEITIAEDVEIQEAILRVEAVIGDMGKRANQLVGRHRDGLLGIFDRGSFDADLAYALRSPKHGVALLMADIDHFKQINDSHGHQVGDSVLRAVANVLASRCGPYDCVPYRYGGEELAVILKGNTAQSATEFAESVRADVEKLAFENRPELKVTISIGVSRASGEDHNVDELVKRADAALYKAKSAGRNRVRTLE
jgi:diguanylate cyclase (GGDEF)-like protein